MKVPPPDMRSDSSASNVQLEPPSVERIIRGAPSRTTEAYSRLAFAGSTAMSPKPAPARTGSPGCFGGTGIATQPETPGDTPRYVHSSSAAKGVLAPLSGQKQRPASTYGCGPDAPVPMSMWHGGRLDGHVPSGVWNGAFEMSVVS